MRPRAALNAVATGPVWSDRTGYPVDALAILDGDVGTYADGDDQFLVLPTIRPLPLARLIRQRGPERLASVV